MIDAILDFLKNLPEELIVFLISVLPLIELRGAVPVGALLLELPFYSNYALSVLGNILPIPFILFFIPKILDFLTRFKLFRPMVEWLRKKADKHSSKVLGKDESIAKEAVEITEASSGCLDGATAQEELTEDSADNVNTADTVELKSCNSATEGEIPEAIKDGTEDTALAPKKEKRKMSKAIFIALLLFVALPVPGTGGWTGALVAALFDLPKKWSLLAIFLGILLCGVIMCLASYGVLGFLSFLLQ